jgi:hypothetical protein
MLNLTVIGKILKKEAYPRSVTPVMVAGQFFRSVRYRLK